MGKNYKSNAFSCLNSNSMEVVVGLVLNNSFKISIFKFKILILIIITKFLFGKMWSFINHNRAFLENCFGGWVFRLKQTIPYFFPPKPNRQLWLLESKIFFNIYNKYYIKRLLNNLKLFWKFDSLCGGRPFF